MIAWSISAQFLRHMNIAEVKIPLHSFLNGFKILESQIKDDTLILSFVHKTHVLHSNELALVKPVMCPDIIRKQLS